MPGQDGVSRREFLTGSFRGRGVALAATGGLVWSHFLDVGNASALTLRPPGALPEADFAASCLRCGQCVEACPYDTLKLAMAEDKHTPIGAPYFEPRKVACQMCPDVPCAAACPTDALQKNVSIEDAEMGLAVLLDQETCQFRVLHRMWNVRARLRARRARDSGFAARARQRSRW